MNTGTRTAAGCLLPSRASRCARVRLPRDLCGALAASQAGGGRKQQCRRKKISRKDSSLSSLESELTAQKKGRAMHFTNLRWLLLLPA